MPTNTSNGRKPKVVSLIRISDKSQAGEDRAGIPRQRSANQNGARHHGLDIYREVVVEDVSGRHVTDDPQFQSIFADLKSGAADGVIVAEQSRLVRPEYWEDFGILDHFKRNRKLVWTPSTCIDPNTREGWYILTCGAMISGDELQTLRERLDGGKQKHRELGRHVNGDQALPRGVEYIRERNPKNPNKVLRAYWQYGPQIEVDRILQAASLIEGQQSYEDTARIIGGGWTGGGIRDALMNPIWIGIRRYEWDCKGEEYTPIGRDGTPRKKRRRQTRRETPQDVEIPELMEKPLMTRERFERLQCIIAERKASWMKSKLKNDGRERHMATGITYCSCGQKMYPRYGSRSGDTDSYICKSRFKGGPGCGMRNIKRIDLDFTIREILVPKLREAEFLLAVLAVHEENRQTAQRDTTQQRRNAELAELKAERNRLINLSVKGIITDEDLKARLEPMNRDIRTLDASAAPVVKDQFDAAAYVERVSAYFAGFANLPLAEQRDMLRRALKEIMIQGNAVLSVTLNGGWVGCVANSQLRSTPQRLRRCRVPESARRSA
jgi:hypothetical protein